MRLRSKLALRGGFRMDGRESFTLNPGSSMKTLVPLADGFEEIEAITIIDVLRRADVEVTTVGLDGQTVNGAHGVQIQADALWADVQLASFDAIVLPGGMGGALRMAEHEALLGALVEFKSSGRLTAAICAAPLVFERAGIVGGTAVTAYPSVQGELSSANVDAGRRVVKAGNIVTSQGPGTAMEFALALVEELCGAPKRAQLGAAMLVESSGQPA
jgi:4-methyl-5(b-hydroxyethyl)-thiazole monophosphate biosynthesis